MSAREYFKYMIKSLSGINVSSSLLEKIREYQEAVIRFIYYHESGKVKNNYYEILKNYINILEEDGVINNYVKDISDEWFKDIYNKYVRIITEEEW